MKRLILCLFIALVVCSASFAFAEQDESLGASVALKQCEDDSDCPDDEICRIYSEDVGCAPCSEDPDGNIECPMCPDDDEEDATYGLCEGFPTPPCESDADCTEDEVCVTYTYETCSGGELDAPPPCLNQDCEQPDSEPTDPAQCSESTRNACVPPYLAPCELDSDCGSGFTCEEIGCSCSSTVSTEDDDAPVPETDCSCEPTGEFYCELDRVECESDADCAPDLFCISATGGNTAQFDSDDQMTSTTCAEGAECDPVLSPDDESYCAPEGYLSWGGGEGSAPELLAQSVGVDSDDFRSSDRVNWGGESAGAGEKSSAGGCTAAGGAPGSVFGLLMIAGMLLRRRQS